MRSTYEQSKLKLDSLKRYVDNLDTLNWVILQYSQGMFDGKPTFPCRKTPFCRRWPRCVPVLFSVRLLCRIWRS